MRELPRTKQELWAAVPPDTWLGSRLDLAPVVAEARDRLAAAREDAQRDIEEAQAELTRVIVEAWMSGASWRAIGVLLGISRQAAARRYGDAVHLAVQAALDAGEAQA